MQQVQFPDNSGPLNYCVVSTYFCSAPWQDISLTRFWSASPPYLQLMSIRHENFKQSIRKPCSCLPMFFLPALFSNLFFRHCLPVLFTFFYLFMLLFFQPTFLKLISIQIASQIINKIKNQCEVTMLQTQTKRTIV